MKRLPAITQAVIPAALALAFSATVALAQQTMNFRPLPPESLARIEAGSQGASKAVVEVPCVVDKNGIHPVRVGEIPPQLAAVMRPHISVHELAVQGALTKDRRLIEQAIMMDPLTGAICTLPQIRAMVKEMFEAYPEYVSDWKQA